MDGCQDGVPDRGTRVARSCLAPGGPTCHGSGMAADPVLTAVQWLALFGAVVWVVMVVTGVMGGYDFVGHEVFCAAVVVACRLRQRHQPAGS